MTAVTAQTPGTGAAARWVASVDVPGAVDEPETYFAVTESSSTLHIVVAAPAEDVSDRWFVGRRALCKRKVARQAHPSDGGRECRDCRRLDHADPEPSTQ